MPSIPPNTGDLSSGRVWRRELTGAVLGLPLLRSGGISCQRVPLGLTPHHHDAWEIHYLERGSVTFATEKGARLRVRGGELCLTQPGLSHWGEQGLVRPSRLLWLVVDPRQRGAERGSPFSRADLRVLADRLAHAGDRIACAPPSLRLAFDELVELLADDGQPLGETRLRLLLCRCLLIAVDALTTSDQAEDPLLAEQALAWMRAHLEDEFSVPDLAAACGLKASRFHEAFRAAAGETPAAAMRRLRCEEAAGRLSHGDDSIDFIAKRLRFASARHLSIWFRRFHGRTPAAWRMEKRQR